MRKTVRGVAAVDYVFLLFAILLVPAGSYWLLGRAENRTPNTITLVTEGGAADGGYSASSHANGAPIDISK